MKTRMAIWNRRRFRAIRPYLVFCILAYLHGTVFGDCPWPKDLADLHGDCVCALNSVQRLSIQCSPVNWTRLLTALHASGESAPIDLLYVNNATVTKLEDEALAGLDVQSLHLSRCSISEIQPKAFVGISTTLTSLNLQDNLLTSVPTEALRVLTSLKQLDLSRNKITKVDDDAFLGLPLTTLKMSDNDLALSDGSTKGLETTLKNLNLKGTGLTTIPPALRKLSAVAFLDLAQNQISGLEPGILKDLDTLTALNLERNRIISIQPNSFAGVNDSLSSLSLLNNLLVEFPADALSTLEEIRVLDLGFNGIRKLPDTAFTMNPYLTLLALDGNPLSTVPATAFSHLNGTLRGLSIGGSYLKCDCKLRWIVEWVRDYDLQVTSRERNPQFCGHPEALRRRSFFQLGPDELQCDETTTVSATTVPLDNGDGGERTDQPTSTSPGTPGKEGKRLTDFQISKTVSSVAPPPPPPPPPVNAVSGAGITVLPPSAQEVKLVDAHRRDSSVTVEWDSEASDNLLGFQVMYRFFGEQSYRRGPPLNPRQRNFTLEDLPGDQCLVVCVVTLEDAGAFRGFQVPASQCRELKTERRKGAELDKIVIAASAAVCGVIVLAVILFICCYKRKRREKPRLAPAAPVSTVGMPAVKSEHEWETLSMYSGRSIPRPRMYHGEGSVNQSFVMDDARSHLSHVPDGRARSTADGQSHRSYSQLSNRFTMGHPEMTKSQQSLSQLSYANGKKKKNNRMTSSSSLHSLTEYDSDWATGRAGNWKDNEVDIYVGQNHVVPSSQHTGKYHRGGR